MIHALIVLILTSIACTLLGVFLILREQSMITDAISHSVLLGIVVGFLITRDLGSPLLLIGATIVGFITAILIEGLARTNLVKKDDAVGAIFPIFFSIAVLLISKYARNTPLSTDMVLMGEVIYAGLNTINIGGIDISVSAIKISIVLLLDLAFIICFFKELKLSTFSEEYAKVMGLPIGGLFNALLCLSSLTSVVAFDAVGGILVISFFVTSAASSLILTKRLTDTLIVASLFAIINSVIGFVLSLKLNCSMSGMVAFISMVNYLLVIIYHKLAGKRKKVQKTTINET